MATQAQASAAGYIVTYFNDVESLTNAYANYGNLMFRLERQYKDALEKGDIEKIPGQEAEQLAAHITNIRFWVDRTHIKTVALKEKVKDFKDADLTKKYDAVMGQDVPKLKALRDYIVEINKLFVKGVVSELVEKAGEIYGQLGGDYGA